jgi:hypothetical protein
MSGCLGISEKLPEVAVSFDHLVGAGEEHSRNTKTESFRSLEIDHKFILRRRLRRKAFAFEDAVDIAGRR